MRVIASIRIIALNATLLQFYLNCQIIQLRKLNNIFNFLKKPLHGMIQSIEN